MTQHYICYLFFVTTEPQIASELSTRAPWPSDLIVLTRPRRHHLQADSPSWEPARLWALEEMH